MNIIDRDDTKEIKKQLQEVNAEIEVHQKHIERLLTLRESIQLRCNHESSTDWDYDIPISMW